MITREHRRQVREIAREIAQLHGATGHHIEYYGGSRQVYPLAAVVSHVRGASVQPTTVLALIGGEWRHWMTQAAE